MDRSELDAVEKRLAEDRPVEAGTVQQLRALVSDIAKTERPNSLADLRNLINTRSVAPAQRGLLQYVLMDMLDQRELEISNEHRLIVNIAA